METAFPLGLAAEQPSPETMTASAPQRALFLVGLASLAGLAANVLFYETALGISWPIFVALAVALLFGAARKAELPLHRDAFLVLAPLAFVATMVAVRANETLITANVLASLFLLGLLVHVFAHGGLASLSLLEISLTPPLEVLRAALSTPGVVGSAADDLRDNSDSVRRLGPVVQGLALAIPVIWIFIRLFMSADQVFAKYVDDFADWIHWPDLPEWIERTVLFVMATWLACGGMKRIQATRDEGDGLLRLASRLALRIVGGRLSPVAAAVFLGVVALLFAAFVAVQIAYYFGGEAMVSQAGFTYAEYARRGFFELLAVAGLTLSLVLGINTVLALPSAKLWRALRGLETVLNVLVFVILASAFKRLMLYEGAYGYTEQRLYVHVFMVALAAVFAWYVLTLWWRTDRFPIGVLVTGLTALVALNVLNPDAFIARQNLERWRATDKVDAAYLSTLSYDAWPALVPFLPQLRKLDARGYQKFDDPFDYRRDMLRTLRRLSTWPAWHRSRAMARQLTRTPGFAVITSYIPNHQATSGPSRPRSYTTIPRD